MQPALNKGELTIPAKNEYLIGDELRKMNAYFEINQDGTIRLHSEGSLGLVNRWGKYNYDNNFKIISISWDDNIEAPSSIYLQKDGYTYKFKIDESEYKK